MGESEAKAKLDPKSMARGMSVFNVLGGFDLRKVATQIDLKKRHYSTTVEKLNGFRTDNPLLLEFKEMFNAELLKVSPLNFPYPHYNNSCLLPIVNLPLLQTV